MHIFDRIRPDDLERRELQLTLVASSAIIILAAGLAFFMFPVVFSDQPPFDRREFAVAFCGFCVLSILLAMYLINRQLTILRLRRHIHEDEERVLAIQERTSAELFKAVPDFNSFQDHLSMEYRRAATLKRDLSLIVVTIRLHENLSFAASKNSLRGDAAKAILQKLRKRDAFYVLQPNCFVVILPETEVSAADGISSRLADGLTDAAGACQRFAFELGIVNYPRDARCAQELESAVCALLPEERPKPMKCEQQVLAGF